jgi:serine/threonine protein kinase/Tfp pilus assembly protein PilF
MTDPHETDMEETLPDQPTPMDVDVDATLPDQPTQSGQSQATLGTGLTTVGDHDETLDSAPGCASKVHSRGTAVSAAVEAAETAPPMIEGYQITKLLGYGGAGQVWKALQQSTQREIALKVLRPGAMASPKAKGRFEREVELSAKLSHPCIVQVYDRGISHGVGYYAMELIEGIHLDRYVQSNEFSHRQMIEILSDIARGVQYAHQKGVIHRDLKPSNIIIKTDGSPVVVDFGLAKALEPDESELELTLDGSISGTPAFMSPEQATGRHDQVDTRSDIFSLCVILYRLITGDTPHDLTGTPYDVQKRIAEIEVRRPREACPELDPEIEAILLKGLAHNPEHRYASAGALADDLDNFLSGDPISAQPATTWYFLRKRLAKHRGKVAIAASMLALLAGMAIYSYISVTEQRDIAVAQRSIAVQQTQKAKAEATVLHNLLWAANPTWAPGREVTVADVLEHASIRIDKDLRGQPELQQQVRDTIGRTYLSLGKFADARREFRKVLAYRKDALGDDHAETLTVQNNLAMCNAELGEPAKAEALYRQAIQHLSANVGSDHPDVLRAKGNLALLLYDRGMYAEAFAMQKAILKAQLDHFGPRGSATLMTTNNVALTLHALGHHDQASKMLSNAFATAKESLGEEHPATLTIWGNLAKPLIAQGKYEEAADLLYDVCDYKERILTRNHPDTLQSMMMLGQVLFYQKLYARSYHMLQGTLKDQRRVLGPTHPDVVMTMSNLGAVRAAMGQLPTANTLLSATANYYEKKYGPLHPELLKVQMNLAQVQAAMGNRSEAIKLLASVLQRQTKVYGPDASVVKSTQSLLDQLNTLRPKKDQP